MHPIFSVRLTSQTRDYLWHLWLVALPIYFWGIGDYPLLDNNEGLYASIAKDMAASTDLFHWIIPHLNGVPYIEKPPLLYWLIALLFKVLGPTTMAARIIPACALTLTTWGLFDWLYKAGHRREAILSATIMPCMLGFQILGRMVMLDMLMTAALTWALVWFWRYHESHSPRDLRKSLACLALAILAKGFVAAILFFLVTQIFWIVEKQWLARVQLVLRDPLAILIFLAILMPWHLAATLSYPPFAWFYFVNEHILRFINLRMPQDYYTGSIFYYIYRVPLYFLPWTPWLLLLLRPAFWQSTSKIQRFSAAWAGALFLFFSLSRAKGNYYLIGIVPPLLTLTLFATRTNLSLLLARVFYFCALCLTGLVLSLIYFLPQTPSIYPLDFFSISFTIFTLGVLCWATWHLYSPALQEHLFPTRPHLLWLPPFVITALFLLGHVIEAAERNAAHFSTSEIVSDFMASGAKHLIIYAKPEDFSALLFYAHSPLPVLESTSQDLWFGQTQGHRPDLFWDASTLKQHCPAQECWIVAKPSQRAAVSKILESYGRIIESSPRWDIWRYQHNLG